MDGNLAATATLVAHTRSWRAGFTRKPSFSPLSAFRYSSDLRVDIPVGLVIPGRERFKPRAPRAWLDWYPRVRARDLRLGVVGGQVRSDDLQHKAEMATFMPFTFTAVDRRGTGVARAAERVVNPEEVEGSLWSVHFVRVDDTAIPETPDVPGAIAQLDEAIMTARTVGSAEHKLQRWIPYLDHALAILREGAKTAQPIDLLPNVGYTEEAHRLVRGALQAWVIGGPLSWSDHEPNGTEMRALYKGATTELYACLLEGVISAVNNGLAMKSR